MMRRNIAKYWLDTEFIEDGKTIELLSIGIVADDGRELYLESSAASLEKADEWVREHVIPHLGKVSRVVKTREEIAQAIRRFCDPEQYGTPEFWAYYADYDWVALCQLFGRMIDIPDGWPKYCLDLKQWAYMRGNPPLPDPPEQEHYALADARWNRHVWLVLRDLEVKAAMGALRLKDG